jgi:hypothetical protein
MDNLRKVCTLALILPLTLSILFSICSLPNCRVQGVNSSSSFTISIVVSTNGNSKTCVFGINPDSSVGYNSKYDSLALNPHSNGNSDHSGLYPYFLFVNQSTLDFLRLQKYIVPLSGTTTSWFLAVEIMNYEGIVTLTWNDTSVASLTLENKMSKEVYANMSEVSSYSYNIFATIGTESDFLIVYHPTAATSPTPNPTPTPSIPEFSWLTILPILLAIPIALITVRKRLQGNV